MSIDSEKATPVIWLVTDGKPGHRNQLKGLGNRLRAHTGAGLYWLEATGFRVPLWRALFGMAPALPSDLPEPDLIVAAGTGTHPLLLSLRRLGNARTLVIMKPGFPLSWVDGAIVPAHDDIKPSSRVLVTEGVMNTITPLARLTANREALILVGGPSPHFDWDDDAILAQIGDLIARYADWRWTISDSRRTPEATRQRLQQLAAPRVTVLSSESTHENWLRHQLSASRAVWTTPDSMSMVCEAATSGVPTGLLDLPARPDSRVAKGVNRLARSGLVAHWSDHRSVMARHTVSARQLWEADRAARWVLERFLTGKPTSDKGKSA
ncbi:mitochondrial fission ELM1 family protein [Marinobacter pelagius]|uniref:mitochondrial fission ELM1 family protein n=1 Tax=Marinobacter sp. C7 TaxID=2951363 RepID=UPI001EF1146D|nr:mitochondrial fission ELM1 family protein [Marinobacter sp. C7]MCG7201361.1 mitochondrial fission ELM1 family protein [Marinobacter sp. C7]